LARNFNYIKKYIVNSLAVQSIALAKPFKQIGDNKHNRKLFISWWICFFENPYFGSFAKHTRHLLSALR